MAQDFPRNQYEIIVVDGGSTDKTQEVVRRYPVKLIIDKNGTIAHGRNIGVEVSRGKYVAFTDADCVVEKSWLKKLVENIEKCDRDVVAVGGPNLVFDNDPPISKVIGYMQESFFGSGGSPQSYRINTPRYVCSVPNCNAIYRRDILVKERYDDALNIGEDGELNFRLKQKGYKFLYLPNIIVWHHRPNNIKEFVKKMFLYGEAMAKIMKKHKKVVRWYAILPSISILALLLAYPIIKLFPIAVYLYGLAIVAYLFALIISTVQVYRRYRSPFSLLTLVLLPLQHFSYGFGFLKGILGGKQ